MLAIDIRDLHKNYGATRALDAVTLQVEARGQIVGLLGPNGAGKTTLVEIVEGLRTATAGNVRVLGLDPVAASNGLRARLGVQLQSTAFIQELTARETLVLFGALYPRRGSVDDALARVSLTDKAGALVRALSGGQRQRLALAMAMLHDPDLFILDEPTSGLDPLARRQIHDILRDLRSRGKTVFVSSHYLDEIEALADRVIVLNAGRIVADGTPLDLLARAAGESTLWIEVESAADPGTLVPQARFDGMDGTLLRYRTIDPTAAIVGLGAALHGTAGRLLDIRLKRPSLEDVYVQLIGAPAEGTDRAKETAHVDA